MNNLGLVLDQPGLSCNHLVATNLLWDTFEAFLERPFGGSLGPLCGILEPS